MCTLFLKGIQIQRLAYFEPEICNNSEEATPCTWRLSWSRDLYYSAQESTRNQAIRSCLGAPVCSRCLPYFNPLLDLLPESVKRGDRIVQTLEMWHPLLGTRRIAHKWGSFHDIVGNSNHKLHIVC